MYELIVETNKWQFSDETMIISRQDSFIELTLKGSDQNNTGKGRGLAAQKPLEDDRNFLVRLFDNIFEDEDSCREAVIKAVSTAIDNAESEGCDATMVHEDITFLECGPSVTEAYVALSFSDDCEPELDITPTGDLKVKKDESLTINLFTSIGNFPLSQQEIKLTANENVRVANPLIFTDSEGKKSFSVSGFKVGDGEVDVSVTFSYYSTTIYASNAELTEYNPYDLKSVTLDTTINIEVVDKLKVATDAVTNFTSTTATVSGNVTDDGGETVTERGVYWGKSADPENKLPLGSGLGGFIGNLADLEPDTDYYVKAYATIKEDTAYGEIVSFKTLKAKCTVVTIWDKNCMAGFIGGNVSCEGESTVIERGLYVNGSKVPNVTDPPGAGIFTTEVVGPGPTELIDVMAYVIYIVGTDGEEIEEHGEEIEFGLPPCGETCADNPDLYECNGYLSGVNTLEFEYERGNGNVYKYWLHIYLIFPVVDGQTLNPYLDIKATEYLNGNLTYNYFKENRCSIFGGCTDTSIEDCFEFSYGTHDFDFCISAPVSPVVVTGTWDIFDEEVILSAEFELEFSKGAPHHY